MTLDLVGVGIGPFNLSLAALLERAPGVRRLFLDRKPEFEWHSELMFGDATMQTCYLKDFVTPVDPTSPHSFLNFLVSNGLFYPFLNTQRTVISRREFEQYGRWVSRRLASHLRFREEVEEIRFNGSQFEVRSTKGKYDTENLCIATGPTAKIPECASRFLGPRVFHAKSTALRRLDLAGKRLVVVGGGQTGLEIFRNAALGTWGRAQSVLLATSRRTLEPLDESAFVNEYFAPSYLEKFWDLPTERKNEIVAAQKLASDGNTPSYLKEVYNDLYRLRFVERDEREIRILASRRLIAMSERDGTYDLELDCPLIGRREGLKADIVILATGFETKLPPSMESLFPRLRLDSAHRPHLEKSYQLTWDGPKSNRVYALNFSRHQHGIADPQTSLMAWRSAVVVNDLCGREVYETRGCPDGFVEHGAYIPNTELA